MRSEPLAQRLRKFRITELCWRARAVSVHLQLRGQPGVHHRLTDLTQTYFEALAQSPAAAGPACRPKPCQVHNNLVLLARTGCACITEKGQALVHFWSKRAIT